MSARDAAVDELIRNERDRTAVMEKASAARTRLVAMSAIHHEEDLAELDLDPLHEALMDLTNAKTAIKVLRKRRTELKAQIG